jgi:hypothetical protein
MQEQATEQASRCLADQIDWKRDSARLPSSE